jgi:hypothetical protein
MSHNKKARTKEGGVGDTRGLNKKKMRNAYTVLVGNNEGKRLVEKLKA